MTNRFEAGGGGLGTSWGDGGGLCHVSFVGEGSVIGVTESRMVELVELRFRKDGSDVAPA